MSTTLTPFDGSRIYFRFPDSGILCLADEYDVDIEGICASSLLKTLEGADAGLNIVILNACRNDPFKASSRSSISGLRQRSKLLAQEGRKLLNFN